MTLSARKGAPLQRSTSLCKTRRRRRRRGRTSSVRRSRNVELNRGMRGSLRKNPLMKTMAMTTTMTPRGWRLASTGSCKAYRRPTFLRCVWRLRKGRKAGATSSAKRRRLLAARVLIRPRPPPRVGPLFRRDLPKLVALSIRSRPLERGC